MAIVQPGNDAFQVILREIATKLGRAEPIVKAVVITTNRAKETHVRLVTCDPERHICDQLKVDREVVVGDGNIARAIADLLGSNRGNEVVIANQHLGGNTHRWVLWNPVGDRPELVGGAEVATSYNNIL